MFLQNGTWIFSKKDDFTTEWSYIGTDNNSFYTSLYMHLGSLQIDMDLTHVCHFFAWGGPDHFVRAKIPKNHTIL